MIKTFIIYFNIFLALLLLLSGYSAYINPNYLANFSFISFAYPIFLLMNIIMLFLWLLFFKKKRFMYISGAAILMTWSSFGGLFNYANASNTEEDFSILTWNVKNFDLYNWSKNEETHEKMMAFLEEQQPDILCLQEFYTESVGSFKNIKEIKERLGYKHYYFGNTFSKKANTKQWGLIIFSKYPIKEHGLIQFEGNPALNACIYADITIEKTKTVRIYNTHLQSIHLGNEDYAYLTELADQQNADLLKSKRILSKLKIGFKRRATQAETVKEHAETYEGKHIICGDFNDTPTSYAYNVLANHLTDAFKEKGKGFGNTLISPFPFFRIDYVLLENSIQVNSYETFRKKHSDHFPVQVKFT